MEMSDAMARQSRNSVASHSIKGYIGVKDGFYYYTDGKDVYRTSDYSPVADVTTGYPVSGRWECTVEHWNHYCGSVYGMTPIK
jgi:hypothetical protein